MGSYTSFNHTMRPVCGAAGSESPPKRLLPQHMPQRGTVTVLGGKRASRSGHGARVAPLVALVSGDGFAGEDHLPGRSADQVFVALPQRRGPRRFTRLPVTYHDAAEFLWRVETPRDNVDIRLFYADAHSDKKTEGKVKRFKKHRQRVRNLSKPQTVQESHPMMGVRVNGEQTADFKVLLAGTPVRSFFRGLLPQSHAALMRELRGAQFFDVPYGHYDQCSLVAMFHTPQWGRVAVFYNRISQSMRVFLSGKHGFSECPEAVVEPCRDKGPNTLYRVMRGENVIGHFELPRETLGRDETLQLALNQLLACAMVDCSSMPYDTSSRLYAHAFQAQLLGAMGLSGQVELLEPVLGASLRAA